MPRGEIARLGPRSLAAAWFAFSGFLASLLFFLPLSGKPHVVILYVLLPSFSAGTAGFISGGTILDSSKTETYRQALMRGLGVTALAFLIDSVLFAVVLPSLEPGWSLREAFGLVPFALLFGALMMGPLAAIVGMVAGAALFRIRPQSKY